jgi:uncharacterized membrane protein YqjE
VGSFNILPWLAILVALAAVVAGSVCLRSIAQQVVAIVLLLGLAIPLGLLGLFVLLLLILRPNFHWAAASATPATTTKRSVPDDTLAATAP